jgi:cell division protein FtsZ
MTSMGKAMMGTGEAEGENRSMAATEMALNNPLIDEYSLQGAKGLLVNITGGSDITLFEVDQAVNKIRAEVDPEAELIFGAIKDENMNGKMRVSIVATALDGQKPESKTILNMVNRIQNRNTGYSDGLFSKTTQVENNTFNSINGATALKLDEEFEHSEEPETFDKNEPLSELKTETFANEVPTSDLVQSETTDMTAGISFESASYMENNIDTQDIDGAESGKETNMHTDDEEHTPQLFSNEINGEDEGVEEKNVVQEEAHDNLFDQDNNDEEDFEIPAFLRRQKF